MTGESSGLGGLVLCGGRSRRMGSPKERLELLGEPLVARVARRLSSVASPIVVAAAAEQTLPPLPAAVVVTRDERSDAGPLEGFRAGLRAFQEMRDPPPLVAVVSCDAPFVDARQMRRLADVLLEDSQAAAAVPFDGARLHPLCAVYRLNALDVAARLLDAGRRRMFDLLDLLTVRSIESTGDWLVNVNHPDEFARVRERVERSGER